MRFFNTFKPLTAEQAKAKVFEHWKHLDAAAKRRFPGMIIWRIKQSCMLWINWKASNGNECAAGKARVLF